MDQYIKRKIFRKFNTSSEEVEDFIAAEKQLIVFVNGKEVISLYCTPSMIKELITGLFMTEGILTDKISTEEWNIAYGDEIVVNISTDKDISTEETTLSRCLGGVTFKKMNFEKVKDDFFITSKALKNIFNEFHQKSELFKLTGCFHSAALSDGKRIIVFAEDIGRHNVIDKVLGHSLIEGIPLRGKLMMVSCRLSSEIISKCSGFGIPLVASRAAPTSLAIEIAELCEITLVGFMRGDRMNIYTHAQRILE